MGEIQQQIENDICDFCMENEDIFLVDHEVRKYKITLNLGRYDEEFSLYYDKSYPKSKFRVEMKGKNNEHTVVRTNSLWELTPVTGIKNALKEFLQNDKEEREYLKKLKEDPDVQKKRMKERMEVVYKKVVAAESKTQLNFNTQLSFQILSDDIINVHLNREQYQFDIEAVDDNPFHWIVSFFGFNDTCDIGKDLQKLETLSSLDCIQMEFKFSVSMFPVFPPEYNFLAPKLKNDTVEKIFHSGAFSDECYNPFTKINLFKIIRQLIGTYGRIDFGSNGKTVADYRDIKFFKEQQLLKPFLGQVVQMGQDFIASLKLNSIPEKNSIQFNSFITQHSPSMERFSEAMKKVEFKSVKDSGFFCWHGSSDECIRSICMDGFDPKRRAGQAYGRGEYFGNTPEISMGYCKGNYHLILCYVLHCSQVKTINIGYVVDNPTDWKYSYCLPLLVITYGQGKPVNFLDKMLN